MDYPPDRVVQAVLFLPGIGLVVALLLFVALEARLRVFWWSAAVWVVYVALVLGTTPFVGYAMGISTFWGLLVCAVISRVVASRRARQDFDAR